MLACVYKAKGWKEKENHGKIVYQEKGMFYWVDEVVNHGLFFFSVQGLCSACSLASQGSQRCCPALVISWPWTAVQV